MISIIIRTYNNEQFIAKAVESALKQEFTDYEVIVVNDGSTDRTAQILATFTDKRLQIITQENRGMIEAGYKGLESAKGEFLLFLDGDDEAEPLLLKELHGAIEKNKKAAFAYSDYYEADETKKTQRIVSCQNIFNTLACGILFRTAIVKAVGFWERGLIFPEYDLLIRIREHHVGVHVAKPLYMYRRHPHSFTANEKMVEEGKKQLFAKYGVIEGFKEY